MSNEATEETGYMGGVTDRLMPVNTTFQTDVNESVDLQVQGILVRAGITDDVIDDLRKEVSGLMKPIHSEEELKELQPALTRLQRHRVTIEKICKKGRERANQERNAGIEAEKRYAGMVKKIEDPLKKYKEDFRAEQERIRQEEEAEAQRQLQHRYAQLDAIEGCVRRAATGGEPERYIIGGTVIPLDTINSADADVWDNLLRSAQTISAEIVAERERQEREAREKAEAAAAQAADLERRQKELEERERKMREAVNESRKNELLAAGCTLYDGGGSISVVRMVAPQHGEAYFYAKTQDLHSWTEEYFQERLAEAKKAVAMREEDDRIAQEKAAREALVVDRVKRLKAAGYEDEGPVPGMMYLMLQVGPLPPRKFQVDAQTMSYEQFLEAIEDGQAELARREAARQETLRQEAEAAARKRIEEEAARKEQEEAERQAKMGDAEKWQEFVRAVASAAPNMSSAIGQHAVKRVIEGLNKMTPGLLRDLGG